MVALVEQAQTDLSLFNAHHGVPMLPQWCGPPMWWQMPLPCNYGIPNGTMLPPYPSTMLPCNYGIPNDWQNGQQKQRCDRSSWRARNEVKRDGANVDLADGPIKGNVWRLARDADGCHKVQDYFDDTSTTNDEKKELAQELVTHVWEAIQCKHANHVIQKVIVTMNPQDTQFVIDEIMAVPHGPWTAARHCFGCRVVERLLEHCRKTQVQDLVVAILDDAPSLCKQQYGNYVAQEILEHGALEHQQKLSRTVMDHVVSMCTDYHAVAVVSQALCSGTEADRAAVARSILRQPKLVLSMARSRHGQGAVKHLLQVPNKEAREDVFRLLTENSEDLQGSRYGKVIVKHLASLRTQPCGSAAQDDKAAEDAIQ